MKNTLSLVHDIITPPLNAVGIQKTWGISIAAFTLSVRTALVPLSIQQTKSAEMMKALKPSQTEIKEKFKVRLGGKGGGGGREEGGYGGAVFLCMMCDVRRRYAEYSNP